MSVKFRSHHGLVVLSVALTGVLFSLPTRAQNDDALWEKFLKYKNQFYLLQNQEFESVTCKIEGANLTALVARMKTELQGAKNLKIEENLAAAQVTYGKSSGLNFVAPAFDMKIVSEAGLADRTALEKSIAAAKVRVTSLMKEQENFIRGLFDEYQIPKRENLTVKEVKIGKVSMARFVRGKLEATEMLNGTKLSLNQKGAGISVSSKSDYEKFEDRLLFKKSVTKISQPKLKIEITMSAEYQTLGKLRFPSKIVTTTRTPGAKTKQPAQTNEVFLSDCQLK